MSEHGGASGRLDPALRDLVERLVDERVAARLDGLTAMGVMGIREDELIGGIAILRDHIAPAVQAPESRPVRLAIVIRSSVGSIGLATCMLKPATIARVRSSMRA